MNNVFLGKPSQNVATFIKKQLCKPQLDNQTTGAILKRIDSPLADVDYYFSASSSELDQNEPKTIYFEKTTAQWMVAMRQTTAGIRNYTITEETTDYIFVSCTQTGLTYQFKKSNWDDVEIPDPEPIGYSLGFSYQVIDSSTGTIKFTFKKPLLRYWYFWAKGRLNFSTPWEVIPTSVVYVTDRDNNVEVTCTGCPNYMFFQGAGEKLPPSI